MYGNMALKILALLIHIVLSVFKAALPVFLCDAFKRRSWGSIIIPYGPMFMILGGILGMMGHNWSVFWALKVVVALLRV